MNLLFVCNLGRNRSRTAAEILSDKHNTRYRGIYSNLIAKEDVAWADLVIVMEDHQRSEIAKRFPEEYLKKKIISIDVPDIYNYNKL